MLCVDGCSNGNWSNGNSSTGNWPNGNCWHRELLQENVFKRTASRERLQENGFKRTASRERLQENGFKGTALWVLLESRRLKQDGFETTSGTVCWAGRLRPGRA